MKVFLLPLIGILSIGLSLAASARPLDSVVYATDFSPSKNDLSLQGMRTILAQKQFSTIDAFMNYLSVTKPKYLSHYALGYASKSVHQSSKSHPRAIVYGETGNFIISFNGDPAHRGYEMLEVMNFNQATKKFEFYEVEFNEKKQLGSNYTISANGGPGGKCLECHTNGRPIWNSYDVWPGFYGASDDFPVTKLNKSNGLSEFFEVPVPQKVEHEWNAFEKSRYSKPRYRHLKPITYSIPFGISEPRPNSDLTVLLFTHNLARIEKILLNTHASNHRYKLLYGMYCTSFAAESPVFSKLLSDFQKRYDPEVAWHDKALLSEHFDELGLTLPMMKQSARALRFNENLFDFTSKKKFIQSFVSFHRRLVADEPLFLAVVEKYLPQAKVTTWPMQLYEGIFRTETGGPMRKEIVKTYLRALFGTAPSPTDQALINRIREEERAYYAGRQPKYSIERECKALERMALR